MQRRHGADWLNQLQGSLNARGMRHPKLKQPSVDTKVKRRTRIVRPARWRGPYHRPQKPSKNKAALGQLLRPSIPFNSCSILGMWLCHEVLKRYPDTAALLPATTRFGEPLDLSTMLDKYPVVFAKPDEGGKGWGISVVRRQGIDCYDWFDPASGRSLENLAFDQVLERVVNNCRNRPFVIQQEIPLYARAGRRGDIRMTLIKDDKGRWQPTVACGVRLAQPDMLVTNCAQGAEWFRFPDGLDELIGDRPDNKVLLQKIIDTSILILRRLEEALGPMGEVGLNLALDQDLRLWLLAANAKPSKEPYDDQPGDPIQDNISVLWNTPVTMVFISHQGRPWEFAIQS